MRIAKEKQPAILLLENVPNILRIERGLILRTIVTTLRGIGYHTHIDTLNASYFGIPQGRKRVYFVCIHNDLAKDITYQKPVPTFERIYLKDVLEKDYDPHLINKRTDVIFTKLDRLLKCRLRLQCLGYFKKGGQGQRVYSIKGHARTLTTSAGGIGGGYGFYWVDNMMRRLSVVENKRIMCFPDTHVISSGRWGCIQLGNAVIPNIVEKVYMGVVGNPKR